MSEWVDDDYRNLFQRNLPLLDLRAPVEFAQGAFPGTTNLPLLTDAERHEVGLCYKVAGPKAAIELGHRLVAGNVREARMQGWLNWCRRHPEGQIYCFRGGLRSVTVQRWLQESGCRVARVHGGYRAMRRFLLRTLDEAAEGTPLVLLSGRTGSGKTRLLRHLERAIDLEELARHRGSAFGRRPGGQPTQIDFENALAIGLLRLGTAPSAEASAPIVLEDESKLIGHRLIPPALFARMSISPRVVIDEPLERRVEITLEDYVLAPLGEYQQFHGEGRAQELLAQELLASLDRIRNRLGGLRHAELRRDLLAALGEQQRTGSAETHREWIRSLLR
jgi:tRNA 2-selenouridine synthase